MEQLHGHRSTRDATPAYKVALFLHCIGADALKIFNGFQFDSPDDRNDLAKIIQKFDEFTIGELNETFERFFFFFF